jgi:CspA family cold shock protein
MKGTIKTVKTDKNFGFITPEDGSKDVFFHGSALPAGTQMADAMVGQMVEFDMEDSDKGPRAVNIQMA